MAVGVVDVFWLLVVGALWGCTNPFLKHASEGADSNKEDRKKGFTPDQLGAFMRVCFSHLSSCCCLALSHMPSRSEVHSAQQYLR